MCYPEACGGHWRPALHLLDAARAAGVADGRAVAATIAACEKGRAGVLPDGAQCCCWFRNPSSPWKKIELCDLEKSPFI